jgi:hypothetical protein
MLRDRQDAGNGQQKSQDVNPGFIVMRTAARIPGLTGATPCRTGKLG